MELDKRILPGKYILTCFDTKEAEKFVGQMGYAADDISWFENLDPIKLRKLEYIVKENGKGIIYPYFMVDEYNRDECAFFLPAAWVQSTEEQQEFITDSKRVAMHIQDYLQHSAYPPSGIIARHSGHAGEKHKFLQNVFEILLDYYKGSVTEDS